MPSRTHDQNRSQLRDEVIVATCLGRWDAHKADGTQPVIEVAVQFVLEIKPLRDAECRGGAA